MSSLAKLLTAGAVLALASVRAAEVSDGEKDRQFKAEANDLKHSSIGQCRGCYFASMLGLVFPLPERYVAQLSPLEDHCVTFVSPRWTLQKPPRREDGRSLQLHSGMIKYCSVAALQGEVSRLGAPTDHQLVRGDVSISIWSSNEKPGSRTTMYASDGREALWISDPNPYLWRTMIDVATSTTSYSQ